MIKRHIKKFSHKGFFFSCFFFSLQKNKEKKASWIDKKTLQTMCNGKPQLNLSFVTVLSTNHISKLSPKWDRSHRLASANDWHRNPPISRITSTQITLKGRRASSKICFSVWHIYHQVFYTLSAYCLSYQNVMFEDFTFNHMAKIIKNFFHQLWIFLVFPLRRLAKTQNCSSLHHWL